jgi:spore germination cell wall hydrolase CwlJ-like protein
MKTTLTALLAGCAMFASSSVIAMQDAASLASVEVSGHARWRLHFIAAPSLSVMEASLESFDTAPQASFTDAYEIRDSLPDLQQVRNFTNKIAKQDRLQMADIINPASSHAAARVADGSTPQARLQLASLTPALIQLPLYIAPVPVTEPLAGQAPEKTLNGSLLGTAKNQARERKCLTDAIYFESRGEPESGQYAVAQVVMNRVRSPHYPDTICGVVYQNKNWRNRCQFSFACDRIADRVTNRVAWKTARRIAYEIMEEGYYMPEIGQSTHYHASYVRPRWIRDMEKEARIGSHIFYTVRNWSNEGV